jgi:hypothetical protein
MPGEAPLNLAWNNPMTKPTKQSPKKRDAARVSSHAKSMDSSGFSQPKGQLTTILFAATGMTPAVLTETVWGLAQEKDPVIPDQVVVVTTAAGAQIIEKELLTPVGDGAATIWQELRQAILGPAALTRAKVIICTSTNLGDAAALSCFRAAGWR